MHNICNVFELSSVAFHLAPPNGGGNVLIDRFATSPSFVLLTDPHVKQPTVNVRLSSHSGTLDFITPHL